MDHPVKQARRSPTAMEASEEEEGPDRWVLEEEGGIVEVELVYVIRLLSIMATNQPINIMMEEGEEGDPISMALLPIR